MLLLNDCHRLRRVIVPILANMSVRRSTRVVKSTMAAAPKGEPPMLVATETQISKKTRQLKSLVADASPAVASRKTSNATQKAKQTVRATAAQVSPPIPQTNGEDEPSKTTTEPMTLRKRKRSFSTDDDAPPTPGATTGRTPTRPESAVPDIAALTGEQARPVQPHRTNAPLQTPRGSRVVAMPLSPEGKALFGDETGITTHNLLDRACAHLIKCDPRLRDVIEQHHCRIFSPEGLCETVDPFQALASGIMAQQVSGAAAKSIKNKFLSLFSDGSEETSWPTPAQVGQTDIVMLRSAGLSQRKAEYIQGLATKFASGELSARMLAEASDDEIMERLTAVRGLGRWSVEMFACFALKRTDIFSTGDLGVQRGMAAYVGKNVAKLKAKGGGKWKYMSEADMLSISEKFSPYRSLFMWYMWRIEDVNVDAIQDNC